MEIDFAGSHRLARCYNYIEMELKKSSCALVESEIMLLPPVRSGDHKLYLQHAPAVNQLSWFFPRVFCTGPCDKCTSGGGIWHCVNVANFFFN